MILASQQVRTGEGLAGHPARAAHFIYGETKAQRGESTVQQIFIVSRYVLQR